MLLGIDRSNCGSVMSQNQIWNQAMGSPNWQDGVQQINEISELTSKSYLDERSSSIGVDLKLIQSS